VTVVGRDSGLRLRAVVLGDTHMRAGGRRLLPEDVYRLLGGADMILHAGDVVDASLLATLESIAPTFAVLGNNDHSLTGALPASRRVDLGGVSIAMVHDSGARQGRAGRLHRRFPDADVVVFGHSHQPMDEIGVEGQLLFNPGSPTERRSSPHHTVGVLEVEAGRLVGHRIVAVGLP
jgi:putative phosphoesterase